MAVESLQMHALPREEYRTQQENAIGVQGSPKPRSTIAQILSHSQLQTAAKPREASTSDMQDPKRLSKTPRHPSRSWEDDSTRLLPFQRPDCLLPASDPSTSSPFFSLTEQELKVLRRKMGKGSNYMQFRDTTVARTLDRLGRGWEGYIRAKEEAGEEGKDDEFWRQIQHEVNSVPTNTKPPAGAISIETAAIAAQSNYTTSVGRLQPESAVEIRRLRENSRQSMSSVPEESLVDREINSPDSTIVCRALNSLPVPEVDSRFPQRGVSEVSDHFPISRPRRNLQRPDYRIQPLPESSPEPSSRIPSPTPRELYDQVQPKFVQYHCEWKKCKASLNNLGTLQKHIRIVHGEEAAHTLNCLWGRCGTGTTYASVEGLEQHFETVHLASLKWSLGDGHKGNGVMTKASDLGFPV
ncbi:hypothetical protein J7T55_011482 [Diaporthe amygdali]|uniref:uncharacterized protein n=1 Tax=Phomopsis amygdali TaxID=1214568 RepID=UPI0022FEB313|nr:uncharacterized protein J7T55_011482 [Diaporthe amygdali]KAJ0123020.1 hypothetical protein J7T55_011482 [Diaporthe amygdali]